MGVGQSELQGAVGDRKDPVSSCSNVPVLIVTLACPILDNYWRESDHLTYWLMRITQLGNQLSPDRICVWCLWASLNSRVQMELVESNFYDPI